MALAPLSFGKFSNHLLVGNFSFAASEINAFELPSGKFRGTIPILSPGRPGGFGRSISELAATTATPTRFISLMG
jgi:hypothetical protein